MTWKPQSGRSDTTSCYRFWWKAKHDLQASMKCQQETDQTSKRNLSKIDWIKWSTIRSLENKSNNEINRRLQVESSFDLKAAKRADREESFSQTRIWSVEGAKTSRGRQSFWISVKLQYYPYSFSIITILDFIFVKLISSRYNFKPIYLRPCLVDMGM